MRPLDTPNRIRRQIIAAARQRGEEFYACFDRFVRQRFLLRLGQSPQRRDWTLKGAMLLPLWRSDARPTTNLDLHDAKGLSAQDLAAFVTATCALEAPEDGLRFRSDTLEIKDMRSAAGYRYRRVTLQVELATARTQLTVNVNSTDGMTPPAEEIEYPPVLEDMEPAKVRAQSKELFIAEKVHTLLELGRNVERMHEFWDIYTLCEQHALAGGRSLAALKSVFEKRIMVCPQTLPDILSPTLASDPVKAAAWQAYARRARTSTRELTMWGMMHTISELVTPLFEAINLRRGFALTWQPPMGPWKLIT